MINKKCVRTSWTRIFYLQENYNNYTNLFNTKGREIVNQEQVIDVLNTSIVGDQKQVDNFEGIQLPRKFDVDMARTAFRSEVFIKWGNSFASGNNRILWNDLLIYIDNINNSNF